MYKKNPYIIFNLFPAIIMIRYALFAIFFLVQMTVAIAQPSGFPVDTSYTVSGTYAKLVRNYPFIKPVRSTAPEGVEMRPDLVYKTIDNTPFGKRTLRAD